MSSLHTPLHANLTVDVSINQILKVDLHDETYTVELDVHFEYKNPWMEGVTSKIWLDRCTYWKGCVTEKPTGTYIVTGAKKFHWDPSTGSHKEVEARDTAEVESYLRKDDPAWDDDHCLFKSIFDTDGNGFLTLSRLVDEPTILAKHRRLCNGNDGTVRHFIKMLATFQETFELRQFPFDCQLLTFTITSGIPRNGVELTAGKLSLRVEETPEYRLHKLDTGTLGGIVARTTGSGLNQKVYWQIKVTMFLERKWHHYVINIVLMLGTLVAASFANYLVPIQEFHNRLSNAVTFVLTSMAMKYLVADQLPKKSYQTRLDMYILGSFFVLCAPALELTLIWLRREDVDDGHDIHFQRWAFAKISFFAWLIGIAVLFYPLVKRLREGVGPGAGPGAAQAQEKLRRRAESRTWCISHDSDTEGSSDTCE